MAEKVNQQNKKDEILEAYNKSEAEKEALQKQVSQQATQMEQMMQMMQQFQEKLDAQTESQHNVKAVEDEVEEDVYEYKEIDANKRISVTQLVYGGTTLKSGRAKYRFEKRGDRRMIKYEDLEALRYDSEYSKLFEQVMVYIKDEDVRVALNLDEYYKKYKVTPNSFNSIAKGDTEEMKKALEDMPMSLQIAFATFYVDKIKENDPDFLDRNKWNVINSHFNIKIAEMINEE